MEVLRLCVISSLALGLLISTASGIGPGVELHLEYDSPLYPTVYHVIEGSVNGLQGVFHDSERALLTKDERFTVVIDIYSPTYSSRWNWYEFPAIFCFGDAATNCLKSAMNRSQTFRDPYLLRASSIERPIPFMVPFVNFTNITLPNGKSVPESGLVHPEFSSRNFTFHGASYDTTTGVLVGFSASSSQNVGKLANMKFTRKRNRLFPQPLTDCYFVEWAPDGCLPGLNILMKGWDMKRLKMASPRWLKFEKFPVNRDQRFMETIDIFEYGPKSFLVPRGVSIDTVAIASVPFSQVFKSVKETVKAELQSYGIKYKEESTETFQGSAKYDSYSKLYSASSYSSAISGMEYKLFQVRFRNSFNFKASQNWDDTFEKEFLELLESQNDAKAMDFFKEYGTHYVREAEMGGRKESLLSVSYCELTETDQKKADFEAKILIPYIGAHSVSSSAYYQRNLSDSDRKAIISGPFTTCRGGNSLNPAVCANDFLWRPTVLQMPYPTNLVLQPFYELTTNSSTQKWLQGKYKEYLVLDLEELREDLNKEAKCSTSTSGGVHHVTVSMFLFYGSLVFSWLLHMLALTSDFV
ncbi:uncharacterized protein [Montipora foliosa]|uniref:uncharacterized protein isoform X1 n=2 Tax=Montipora foliosa TaxID=591990 RepID=UPI0035F1A9DA